MRKLIQEQVVALMDGTRGKPIDLDGPPGDLGLFGPKSMVWKVHADFTTMMIGGVAALLVQMLHPGALAGVWDHSDFRADMRGRLRRTAQFISGTSYGSTAEAERLIARVRVVHDQVAGTLADGTPYSANDPHLLTWVHVAEASCFLAAYVRYRAPATSGADQDRYFAESALVAERLGATGVPRSRREVEAYLRAIRPELRCDERTSEVAGVLLSEPAPSLMTGPFRTVTLDAAIDLMPVWAAEMHGFASSRANRHLVRVAAGGVGAVLRWALNNGSATRAERRVRGGAAVV